MSLENSNEEITEKTIGVATAWSFAAEIAAKIIVPITNIVLARILAPEAFGVIATINMVVSFADTFSTAGFQKYIVQHDFDSLQELYQGATVAFWTNFSISTFAWLLIAVFNSQIADFVGNSGYGFGLMIAALSLPLTSFSCIQEALFQRQLNYKVLFYRRLVVSLLPFFVTIPLALLGLGYWALIIGTLTGNVVKAILLTITSEWKPRLFFDFNLLHEMLSFSIWTLFESIAMWASSYIDILIISNGLGAYYTGLYKNSQSTVTSILTIVTGATTSVLFSSLSRMQDDDVKFNEVFYSFQKSVAIFVLPIGVGIFFFSDLITRILLGTQWLEASPFISIWGLCTSLVCVFGTFSREVYRAKGKPKISLIAQLLHLAFIVPVCLVAVQKGFDTLIYARSFAYLQIIVVHLFFIKIFFHMSPLKMFCTVKEPIICSVAMGGLAYLLLHYYKGNVLIQLIYVVICAMFYFALLCLFKEYRVFFFDLFYKVKTKMTSFKKAHGKIEL